jgi:hypothetical protein
MGLILPPIQWVLGSSLGIKQWGAELTTHLHLVPRLRIRGVLPALSPHTLMPWTRKFNFTLLLLVTSQSAYLLHSFKPQQNFDAQRTCLLDVKQVCELKENISSTLFECGG